MADTLNVGDVFLTISPESGVSPHYYIVVHKTNDNQVLVVYTTKEVEKVRIRCQSREGIKFPNIDPATMVPIDNTHCASLTLPSAIDCNNAALKSEEYFLSKQYFIRCSPVTTPNILTSIKHGIKQSPLIADAIKNLI
jgi:hypothetical protein